MKSYSIKNVSVIVSALPGVAPHKVNGFSKGDDVISIEFNEDAVMTEVGADGQMSIALSADESATLKLKLSQTSKSNRVFDRIINLQRSINGAVDFAPCFVKVQDVYRQDAAVGVYAVIKKKPPMVRGAGLNSQEWEIIMEKCAMTFGDTVGTLVTAAAEAAS